MTPVFLPQVSLSSKTKDQVVREIPTLIIEGNAKSIEIFLSPEDIAGANLSWVNLEVDLLDIQLDTTHTKLQSQVIVITSVYSQKCYGSKVFGVYFVLLGVSSRKYWKKLLQNGYFPSCTLRKTIQDFRETRRAAAEKGVSNLHSLMYIE